MDSATTYHEPSIILTRENLHALCGSPHGEGFTNRQLALLGVSLPAKKGWLSALRGRRITVSLYDEIKSACAPRWKNKELLALVKPVSTMQPSSLEAPRQFLANLDEEIAFTRKLDGKDSSAEVALTATRRAFADAYGLA